MKAILLMAVFLALISTASAEVIISEIMYAPTEELGGTYAEWLEIYNPDSESVNLTGWKIADPTNHSIEGETSIEHNGYLIIAKSAFFSNFSNYYDVSCPIAKAGFYLNNDGEEILIIDSNGSIIADLQYSKSQGAHINNMSLQLVDDDWCEGIPTPGKDNECYVDDNPEEHDLGENIENSTVNNTYSDNETQEQEKIIIENKTEKVKITSNAVSNPETKTVSGNLTGNSSEKKKVIYQSKTDRMKKTALYLSAGLFVLLGLYLIKSNKL